MARNDIDFAAVFGGITLPKSAAGLADGASLQVLEEPQAADMPMPFFGGFAEDMLADIGFDIVEEAPAAGVRAKLV
jgi:hypothetical protein